MNGEQIEQLAVAGGAVVLVLLVVCALLWRTSRRLNARIDELEAGLADGRHRTPNAAAAPVASEPAAYVITGLHEAETAANAQTEVGVIVPGRIDGRLFADIVARESVVRAAGLAHGLRRGLSAESRNRIRFEMKREVKRSRKQRRADLKAALREVRERQMREDAA